MADQTRTLKLCIDLFEQTRDAIEGYVDVRDSQDGRPSPNWAMSLTQDIDGLLPMVRAAIAQARLDHDGAIAELRAELEQQRTRAEAAEFDLHAERLEHTKTQQDLDDTEKALRREIENNARECREVDRG